MKKLGMFLLFVLSVAVAMPCAYAQSKDQKNAEKAIKKEVKALTKEGWKVAPGNLSMELQLKESYAKALDKDAYGYDNFVSMSSVTSV